MKVEKNEEISFIVVSCEYFSREPCFIIKYIYKWTFYTGASSSEFVCVCLYSMCVSSATNK